MSEQVITRMSLNIINKCNQRCSWCFEGEWKKGPTQLMHLDDVERLLSWKDWDDGFLKWIFILGGEPTLHPQVLEILDLIGRFNSQIMKNFLSNLTCDLELLKELVARKVVFFVNVDQFEETNNSDNLPQIIQNLEYLGNISNENFRFNVAVTVSEPDKDFTFLYDILKLHGDRIYNVRVAPSCIGLNFDNQFQTEATEDYYQKVLEVMRRCRKIQPSVRFSSECPANGCMISESLFDKLKKYNYDLRFVCGDPAPNADILPDLSCHWCYALDNIADMKINNVLDYTDYNSMVRGLYKLKEKFDEKYSPQCEIENCTHLWCRGPCPALNYFFYQRGIKLKRAVLTNRKKN